MAEPIVEVKNLTKVFGDVIAVNDISFSIEEKEFLVLLGPSGCGKTTILRMIAGLEVPSSGEIYLHGRLVYSGKRDIFVPARERGVGLVFQSYALWPHMTVFENIAFGLRVKHHSQDVIRKKVENGLSYMKLSEMAYRYPQEMSGGQQQRVALARMLVSEPEIFLMDEPLSNLDAKLRLEMRGEIKSIHYQTGATTIYVTHDQVEALTMATRIAVLNQGRIEQMDEPKKVYRHPATLFVADFIGSPTINKLEGSIAIDHDSGRFSIVGDGFSLLTNFNSTDYPEIREGANVIVGVRPENIVIDMDDTGDNRAFTDRIPGNTLVTEVKTVLPAGPETILQVKFHGNIINILVTREVDYNMGEKISIYIPPEQILVFSIDTGKIILPIY